jgi:hypothetical protein
MLGKVWDPTKPTESVNELIRLAGKFRLLSYLTVRWQFWEWTLTKVFRRGPKGVFKTTKMLKLFRELMPPTIGDAQLPLRITATQVNLQTTHPVLFTASDIDLPLAVLASMTLPAPIFDPTMWGKAMLQDGGWLANLSIPKDQKRVVALYFGEISLVALAAPIEGAELVPVKDNIDLLLRNVLGTIDGNMRRSIEDAEEEGVELLRLALKTDLEGGDFFASSEAIQGAIQDGYDSATRSLNNGTSW